jgi:DNA modification methylase
MFTINDINAPDQYAATMQMIEYGMNEKSIIDETPNRYKSIHPTEKPVRLMERLLGLVLPDLGGGTTAFGGRPLSW